MSHQVVECRGCLTKLRVRESATTFTLQCPRCGEQLAVDPPEPAPAREAVRRATPPASRPAANPPKRAAAAPTPSKEHLSDLKKVLEDTDGLMHDAKRRAVRTLARLGSAEVYPDLIMAMPDSVVRDEVKQALIEVGSAAEAAILESFDKLTDDWAKRELLEVLKKVGTAKCESFLEKQATSNDVSLRNNAQQALDAVRSRL